MLPGSRKEIKLKKMGLGDSFMMEEYRQFLSKQNETAIQNQVVGEGTGVQGVIERLSGGAGDMGPKGGGKKVQ